MSDYSQIVVDVEVTAADAPRLADSIRQWLVAERIIQPEPSDSVLGGEGHRPGANFRAAVDEDRFLTLVTNGLEIRVGRQVFESSANGIELQCASCQACFDPGDGWFAAVDKWAEGDDEAALPCPSCNAVTALRDWRGPWPWAFGNLGFEFWNWPPLKPRFLESLTERLGHTAVLVRRHI